MILGSYYLTLVNPDDKGHGKIFRDEDEAMMAYSEGLITLQAPIKCAARWSLTASRRPAWSIPRWARSSSTPHPAGSGYVDRTNPATKFDYEMNPRTLKIASGGKSDKLTKKGLPDIISRCLTKHGTKTCAMMLDQIKAQGYKYSTLSAITVAVPDALCLTRSRKFWLPPIRRSRRS